MSIYTSVVALGVMRDMSVVFDYPIFGRCVAIRCAVRVVSRGVLVAVLWHGGSRRVDGVGRCRAGSFLVRARVTSRPCAVPLGLRCGLAMHGPGKFPDCLTSLGRSPGTANASGQWAQTDRRAHCLEGNV